MADVLGRTATGAGIGAMAGSVVPVLGTGVGAVAGGALGALSGLFSGGGDQPLLPVGPEPAYADYNKITNPDGTLQSNLQINPGAPIEANPDGIDAYRKMALRDPTQASPWAQMQLDRQAGSQKAAMDAATTQSASGTNGAQSQLAMNGGLTSGAAERTAIQGQRGMLGAQQDVMRQGSDQKLNIGIQDEQNRVGELSQLPQMEIAQTEPAFRNQANNLNAQQFNISNAIGENRAQNLASLQKYQTQMGSWAALNQANADITAGNAKGK